MTRVTRLRARLRRRQARLRARLRGRQARLREGYGGTSHAGTRTRDARHYSCRGSRDGCDTPQLAGDTPNNLAGDTPSDLAGDTPSDLAGDTPATTVTPDQ